MVKATKTTKAEVHADDSFDDSSDGSSLLIDMDSIEESSFEVIPKGTYDVVIDSVELKISDTSGKPYWNLTLLIQRGGFKGRKLWHIMSFSPGALATTKSNILKFAPDILSSRFDPKAIAESGELVGKKFQVKTKIEPYNGEDRTRVAQVLAAKDDDGFED